MEPIVTGFTETEDEETACRELAEKIQGSDVKLSFLFASREYDFEKLSKNVKKHFKGPVIGCSTAGEITPNGFSNKGIVGVAFNGSEFEADLIPVPDLTASEGQLVTDIKRQFLKIQVRHRNTIKNGKTFGVLFIDGLSVKEEEFVSLVDNALNGLPFIGGSAGDSLEFVSTLVYTNEKFSNNSATLAIITTTLPFELFKSHNFQETSERFVITASSPQTRTIQEIEGLPAAQFYAEKLGLNVSELTPEVFSKNPVMLKIGEEFHVRSIQKMNEDLSFTFFCAIDNGLVLRFGSPRCILNSTREMFTDLDEKIGRNKLCLSFECVLRRIEILAMPEEEKERLIHEYKINNMIGFHTFGEQLGGIHNNQTLTGVAFGRSWPTL
jgi:hypothetical protein